METPKQIEIIMSRSLESIIHCLSNNQMKMKGTKSDHQSVLNRKIQKVVAESLSVNPETLLSKALRIHGEEFLKFIAPSFRGSLLIMYGGSSPKTTEVADARVEAIESASFDRFWAWVNKPNNSELMKVRTMKGILNTVSSFCDRLPTPPEAADIMENYLQELVVVSNRVTLTEPQVTCICSIPKIQQQHADFLNAAGTSKKIADAVRLLEENVYVGKLVLQPVAWAEVSISPDVIGRFIGRKGSHVKQMEAMLEKEVRKILSDDGNNKKNEVTVHVKCTTSPNAEYGTILAGAWVTDEDIFTRFRNHSKFTAEVIKSLSTFFQEQLEGDVGNISVDNASSVDYDEEESEYMEEWIMMCDANGFPYWYSTITGDVVYEDAQPSYQDPVLFAHHHHHQQHWDPRMFLSAPSPYSEAYMQPSPHNYFDPSWPYYTPNPHQSQFY
jgi:predicted RNA-binding protein YlqC (UPF0109 family)